MNLREREAVLSGSFLRDQNDIQQRLKQTFLLVFFIDQQETSVIPCSYEGLSGDVFTRSTIKVSGQ